mmetsp:Transcript_4368/g.6382  ORF Transcript_4368/g.6382 Transcript_4368/m.6382 type:complete len:203 (+) Transcript_4368:605-1213(+)
MWRKETMLTIRLHTLFTSFVSSSPITGKLTLSTNLPTTPKGILYMSLSKIIDNKVRTEMGCDTMMGSDGVTMLQKLEDELGLKQYSTLGIIDLLSDLSKVKKDKREKLLTYHRRFTHAVDECIANNVMPYNDFVLIILYLRNMNEVCLHPAILSLQQGQAHEWSAISTLEDMHTTVKNYLKAAKTLSPSQHKLAEDKEPRPQ